MGKLCSGGPHHAEAFAEQHHRFFLPLLSQALDLQHDLMALLSNSAPSPLIFQRLSPDKSLTLLIFICLQKT